MRRRGYTLIEVLVLVVIMGIAAALVIPSMGSTGVLRVQAAVRTVVSDVTAAQSDAVAFQQARAIVFYPDQNRYVTVAVPGSVIDPELNRIWETAFVGADFGDSQLVSVDFSGGDILLFDEMGAPIVTPGGAPAPTGAVTIAGSGETFRIDIQGYTGRVTVQRVITGGGGGGGGPGGGGD